MNCLHKTVYTAFTIHTVFINFTDNTVQCTAPALLSCIGLLWAVQGPTGLTDYTGLYWAVQGPTQLYYAVLGYTGIYWAYIADGANRADGAEGADWADGAEGADRADGADRTDWADVAEMVNMALPSYEHYSILSAFDIRSSKVQHMRGFGSFIH